MLTGPKLTAFATTDVAPENGLRMSLAEGVELQSNLLRVSHPSIDCVSSCNCGINSEALDTKLACGRNIVRNPMKGIELTYGYLHSEQLLDSRERAL